MTTKYPLVSYSSKVNYILPYIVVPILERQDQIILAPEKVLEQHNSFINSLGRSSELTKIEQPFARSFKQKEYLNIYISFPSNRTEDSGRGGLALTLGILLHSRILAHDLICYNFMNYFMWLFNKHFELDLVNHGESDFIGQLENMENYEILNQKLVNLYDEFKESAGQFQPRHKITFFQKHVSRLLGRVRKSKFPKAIFTLVDLDRDIDYKTLMPFFYAVDKYIKNYNIHGMSYSTLLQSQSKYVKIIPCTKEELYQITYNSDSEVEINYELNCAFMN